MWSSSKNVECKWKCEQTQKIGEREEQNREITNIECEQQQSQSEIKPSEKDNLKKEIALENVNWKHTF